MSELISNLIANAGEYSKEYPVVAGGIGIWALGVGTYFFKVIPRRVLDFAIKHLTTRLQILSTHNSYHEFLQWFEENDFSSKSRSIKISNGRYGYSDMIKAMGYGTQYFWYGWIPIRITLSKQEGTTSERERDEISMIVLGRSHKVFDRIFKEVKERNVDANNIVLMKYSDHNWSRSSAQRKRPIESVCLNKGVSEKILGFIDNFEANEKFHTDHGINHQTAIMLYGPPGTGKTSFIKAIATHYDRKIYMLKPSDMSVIMSAFSALPENAIVVIEDIDSNPGIFSRGESDDKKKKKKEEKDDQVQNVIKFELDNSNISDVLNAIDGVAVSHGRILIATTNHIDKLDPALLRSGRFDLKLKLDYADEYAFENFFKRFYPDAEFPEGYVIKDEVCPSDLQQFAVMNLDSPDDFLEEFRCK